MFYLNYGHIIPFYFFCLWFDNNNFVFVIGARYSKLNQFDHIEFLAPPWVTNAFCNESELINIE